MTKPDPSTPPALLGQSQPFDARPYPWVADAHALTDGTPDWLRVARITQIMMPRIRSAPNKKDQGKGRSQGPAKGPAKAQGKDRRLVIHNREGATEDGIRAPRYPEGTRGGDGKVRH